MEKIYRLGLPSKKDQTKTYLICGDLHAQFIHKPTFDIFLAYAESLPKEDRNLIINGDLADFPYFMMGKNPQAKKWIKRADGVEEFFLPHYREEINFINDKILNPICRVFEEVYFVDGNHDQPRIDAFLGMCPHEYHHHFNLSRDLMFKPRGIVHAGGYNDWIDLGKLAITHGMFHGTTALKKHVDVARKSVIFSHVHVDEVKAFATRDAFLKAWSLPAMCGLNPHYIKNRDSQWTNGFGEIQVFKDGLFHVDIHTVYKNRSVIRGQVFKSR